MHFRALRDEAGRIIDFALVEQNQAAARINGYESGESADGSTMLQMFPAVRDSAHWAHFCESIEQGTSGEEELSYRDARLAGHYRIWRSRPVAEHLVLLIEDVTAVRREQERQREEALTHEIMLRVARAISGLDIDVIVQAVTDEATASGVDGDPHRGPVRATTHGVVRPR